MRRLIIAGAAVWVFATGAGACVCTSDIVAGFNDATNYIVTQNVEPQVQEISTRLIPAIEENTQRILEQNEEIKKLIEAEKMKALQYRKLIFFLEQRAKLHTAE